MMSRTEAESSLRGDHELIRGFYRKELALHGLNHRGVGFNRRISQQRRFEALAAIGSLHGRRILDVGCGLGGFLEFLWARGVIPEYTGLDLCEEFIDHCRKRFTAAGAPGPARFELGDILELHPAAAFDHVVSSGIFGYKTPEVAARVRPALAHMLACARRSVAVNFLSRRAPRQAPRSMYFEPTEVLGMALDLTPAVFLKHDYLPNDFTVYLFAEPRWAAPDEG